MSTNQPASHLWLLIQECDPHTRVWRRIGGSTPV